MPIHDQRLAPVLPIYPQLLDLKAKPCHLFLEVSTPYLLSCHHSDLWRENPQWLRDVLELGLFKVGGHFDVNCVCEILRTLSLVFLK